jgi:hypothetical protein
MTRSKDIPFILNDYGIRGLAVPLHLLLAGYDLKSL